MASWKAGTSGDAAGASGCEYQVFLNFRGEDTRHNFTAFLYDRLVDVGIHTFRDEEKLPIGDVISDRLERAINNSKLYIPIFSQNYASSKWCLRELKLIMDNVSNSWGQKSIFPIFFLVKPDDLKLKTRPDTDAPYKAAFKEHEKNFPSEVEAWKTALGKVDERKGWVVEENTSQAEIVEKVVENVLEKLEIKQKGLPRHLVRLDDHIKRLVELSDINQCDVRLIAIYGMGGIGKTTMAKVIFNKLSPHFKKYSSFLEDVRVNSSTEKGKVRLQKKLLSDIFGSKMAEQVKDSEQGTKMIRQALPTKKVLVILDDVAEEQHIKHLIGNYSLRLGSRIIITTRDQTIPPNEGFYGEIQRREMPEMDDHSTLQLFCRHALGKDSPSDDYRWLSNEIVSSVGTLPLAIEVIGSSLKGRKKAVWKETLDNLKNAPKEKILNILKISYDGLDKNQKEIFLDIACFFFNEEKTDPIHMWSNYKLEPLRGIEVLIERCLIKIVTNDKFWMHDQLIALGRHIVCEANQGELRKQSRLWIAEQALEIIRTEESKGKVQALELDGLDDSIEITNQEFERLQNVRYLKLYDGTYIGDFTKCHSKLRWISWRCPRQDFRADNMYLDHLVVFRLGANCFTDDSKAWDLIKRARNLKVISLTECDGITTIPDFSKCLDLERLTLAHCNKLKRIKSFIGHLKSLSELHIEWCAGFTEMPEEVGALVNLERFSLQGCSGLSELPGSLRNLTSLIELDLSGTSITRCNLTWIGRNYTFKWSVSKLPNMNVPRDLASHSHPVEFTVYEKYIESVEFPPSLTHWQIKESPSLGGPIHPSNKTEGGEEATASRTITYWKVRLKVGLNDRKEMKKAMKICSAIAGVDSIDANMKSQMLTVVGAMDPSEVVWKLKEMFEIEIISFRPAREAISRGEHGPGWAGPPPNPRTNLYNVGS